MRSLTTIVFVVVFLLFSTLGGPAHAYLDPGTGSIVIQAVLAGVVGGLTFVKLFWHRVKGAVFGRTSKDPDADRR